MVTRNTARPVEPATGSRSFISRSSALSSCAQSITAGEGSRPFEAIWQILTPQHRRLLLAKKAAGSRTELLAGCLLCSAARRSSSASMARSAPASSQAERSHPHWKATIEACAAGFNRYDRGIMAGGCIYATHDRRPRYAARLRP
jgi:hypothetical protein